ncbi:hypothetical protein [Caldisericum sp.]|uniref:hypothetical protein n=1 Tax=Caldisericum sp. TaxID=2499687 RepID=UPI003D0C3D96
MKFRIRHHYGTEQKISEIIKEKKEVEQPKIREEIKTEETKEKEIFETLEEPPKAKEEVQQTKVPKTISPEEAKIQETLDLLKSQKSIIRKLFEKGEDSNRLEINQENLELIQNLNKGIPADRIKAHALDASYSATPEEASKRFFNLMAKDIKKGLKPQKETTPQIKGKEKVKQYLQKLKPEIREQEEWKLSIDEKKDEFWLEDEETYSPNWMKVVELKDQLTSPQLNNLVSALKSAYSKTQTLKGAKEKFIRILISKPTSHYAAEIESIPYQTLENIRAYTESQRRIEFEKHRDLIPLDVSLSNWISPNIIKSSRNADDFMARSAVDEVLDRYFNETQEYKPSDRGNMEKVLEILDKPEAQYEIAKKLKEASLEKFMDEIWNRFQNEEIINHIFRNLPSVYDKKNNRANFSKLVAGINDIEIKHQILDEFYNRMPLVEPVKSLLNEHRFKDFIEAYKTNVKIAKEYYRKIPFQVNLFIEKQIAQNKHPMEIFFRVVKEFPHLEGHQLPSPKWIAATAWLKNPGISYLKMKPEIFQSLDYKIARLVNAKIGDEGIILSAENPNTIIKGIVKQALEKVVPGDDPEIKNLRNNLANYFDVYSEGELSELNTMSFLRFIDKDRFRLKWVGKLGEMEYRRMLTDTYDWVDNAVTLSDNLFKKYSNPEDKIKFIKAFADLYYRGRFRSLINFENRHKQEIPKYLKLLENIKELGLDENDFSSRLPLLFDTIRDRETSPLQDKIFDTNESIYQHDIKIAELKDKLERLKDKEEAPEEIQKIEEQLKTYNELKENLEASLKIYKKNLKETEDYFNNLGQELKKVMKEIIDGDGYQNEDLILKYMEIADELETYLSKKSLDAVKKSIDNLNNIIETQGFQYEFDLPASTTPERLALKLLSLQELKNKMQVPSKINLREIAERNYPDIEADIRQELSNPKSNFTQEIIKFFIKSNYGAVRAWKVLKSMGSKLNEEQFIKVVDKTLDSYFNELKEIKSRAQIYNPDNIDDIIQASQPLIDKYINQSAKVHNMMSEEVKALTKKISKEIDNIYEQLIQGDEAISIQRGLNKEETINQIKGFIYPVLNYRWVKDIVELAKTVKPDALEDFNQFNKLWDLQVTRKISPEIAKEILPNKDDLRIYWEQALAEVAPEKFEKILTSETENLLSDEETPEQKILNDLGIGRVHSLGPLSLPVFGYLISNYAIPEDKKELKDIIFYGSLLAAGGYYGWRLYRARRDFAKLGSLNDPEKFNDPERIKYSIFNSPLYQAIKERSPSKLMEFIHKAELIHKFANNFDNRSLILQATRNPIAKKIYTTMKEIEGNNNLRVRQISTEFNKAISDFTPEELGLIDKIMVDTQRELYAYRRDVKLGKQEKPKDWSEVREKILNKNIEKNIIESKIKYNKAGTFSSYVERIQNGINEIRNINRKATEEIYYSEAAKKLGIPREDFEIAYETAKKRIEEINKEKQEKIKKEREQIKGLKTIIKEHITDLYTKSKTLSGNVANSVLTNPEIQKYLTKYSEEQAVNDPKFLKKVASIINKISKEEKLNPEIKSTIKLIQQTYEQIHKIKNNIQKIREFYNKELKAQKQIENILNRETVDDYLFKSENLVFWNPLWNRTFGDYGVKIESYNFENDIPIEPMNEWLAPTKVVMYDYSPKGALNRAAEYLSKEGYEPHPQIKDIYILKDKEGKIQDMVRLTQFNRKVLDLEKVHYQKFVEDLKNYYGAFAKIYSKLLRTGIISNPDIQLVQEFKQKVLDFAEKHKIDHDVMEDEFGIDFKRLTQLAKKKTFEAYDVGKLYRMISIASGAIPMLRYRDYVGYETGGNLKKRGDLFVYSWLQHFNNLMQRGLENNIVGYLKNRVDNFILNYGLQYTPFANYMNSLKQDLIYSPISLYQKGLIPVGQKVIDLESWLNNASALSYTYVFLGNISAALRNIKYNMIINPVNLTKQGESPIMIMKNFITKTPNTFVDFMKYFTNRYSRNKEDVPVISNDPLKQEVFEKVYRSGFITQSVMDLLTSEIGRLNLRRFLSMPIKGSEKAKLLTLKLAFFLQRNSEIFNKLFSFETRYDFLRRQGITDPNELAKEIILGIGNDVGFYQTHDLGRLTREFAKNPLTAVFLQMLKPAIIQNYNYLETIRVPYQFFKERLLKKDPTINAQEALNHIKALGTTMVLTTLLGGWMGFPGVGDILQLLDKYADEVSRENPNFDPKGLNKIRLQLQQFAADKLGIKPKDFNDYWLAISNGVDSYLINRNLSVNNLLGPYLQPFIFDFLDRQIKESAKLIKGEGDLVELFTPFGIKRIKTWLKDIWAGQVLTPSELITYESGRRLDLRDYLFGYLGRHLDAQEINFLRNKNIYEFYTLDGRKRALKDFLNKVIQGTGSTVEKEDYLNEILQSDPNLDNVPSLYFAALNIYKKNYSDYVVQSIEEFKKELKDYKSNISRFLKEKYGIEEIYGNTKNVDAFLESMKRDISNYYQYQALLDAIPMFYKNVGIWYTLEDEYDLRGIPFNRQGLHYAIRRKAKGIKDDDILDQFNNIFGD